MKRSIIFLTFFVFLLISCRKNSKESNFNLDDVVKVEVINKTFRKENYLGELIVTDSEKIKELIGFVNNSKISKEDLNKSGGTQGFIETKFIDKNGEKVVFNNLYTVHKGVFVIHYEEWDTKAYTNIQFVDEIENLLYKGQKKSE